MPSPTFSGIGTAVAISDSGSVGRPAVAEGDFMLLVVGLDYSDATVTASGWTLIQSIDPGSVFASQLTCFYKIAGPSEPSTYSITITGQGGGNNVGGVVIAAWTGNDTATPVDASDQQTNASSTTSQAKSVTATEAATTLVTVHFVDEISATGTYTAPTGMTERFDGFLSSGLSANRTGIFDEPIAASGATGTRDATLTVAHSTKVVSFLIRQGGPTPSITSTSSGTPRPGDSLTITGTAFGASQGNGSVTLGGVVQPVTSWGDTSITITVRRGTAKYAAQNIVVRDNAQNASAGYAVTLTPPVGWAATDLTSINGTAEYRLRASPDLASGDQIAYTTAGGVVVAADGTFSWVFGARAFDFEVWTSADGWGGIVSQYLLPPVDPRAAYDALAIDYRMNAARKASAFKLHPSTWGVTPLVPAKWVADELVTAAGGGGSTYDVSLAEAAAASDLISAAMLQVAALAEAATATDAYAAQAAFVRALAEAAAAGDVQAAALLALAALTEPATAAEALTAGLALGASALEAAAAADSQVAALLAAAAAAEAAAAADAAAAGLLAGAAVTEAAAAGDAQSTGPVLTGAVSESVTLADALAAVAALLASMVEAAAAAESAGTQMTRTGAVSEAAAAVEAQTTGPQVSASLAETVAAAEALATAMNLVAQIAEAGTAAEVLNTAAALGALLTEPAVPVDSIAATAAATYSASVAETVSALEAIVALLVSGAFNPSAPPQLRREAAARLANIQAATRGRNTNRGTR